MMKYLPEVLYQGGFVMGLEDTPLHRRMLEVIYIWALQKYFLDFPLCSVYKL